MANNVYIGNRYVPVFADPVEWDSLRAYENLTIVTYQGTSYTSRKNVPAGTALSNTEYWVPTGNYNAQVEQYRQEVVALGSRVTEAESDITTLDGTVTTLSGNVSTLTNKVDLLTTKKYIFIGDSYANSSGTNNGWVAKLVTILGLTSSDYYQSALGGIGFTTSPNNFLSLLTALGSSISNKNAITDIVVCGGANDLSQTESTVVTNIQSFISYCNTNYPNAIIHIGDCAGTTDVTRVGAQYSRVARGYQWGSYGKNVHPLRNLCYVFNNRALIGDDTIHPTADGYDVLAVAIAEALNDGYNAYYMDNDKRVVASSSASHEIASSTIDVCVDNNITSLDSLLTIVIQGKNGGLFGLSANTAFEIGSLTSKLMYGAQSQWQRSHIAVGITATLSIGGNLTNFDIHGTVYVSNNKLYLVAYGKAFGDTGAWSTSVRSLAITPFTINSPSLFC